MDRFRRTGIAGVGALLAIRMVVAFEQGIHGDAADYVAFATGAKVLAQAGHCLYCLSDQASAQVLVLGYHPPPPDPGFPAPFVSPPPVAWLFQPLAALPLTTALPIYLAVMLAAVAVSAVVLKAGLAGRIPSTAWRNSVIVLAVGALPGATALLLGQVDPVALLAAALAVLALTRDRPALAGLLLSCTLVKPQLVWLVPAALLAGRHWRAAAGFAAGAAAWAVASLLIIGPGGLPQWYHYIADRLAGQAVFTRGPAGIANAAGGAAGAVYAAGVVLALTMLAGIFLGHDRLRDPLTAVAVGIAASAVCSPHLFSDDLMLLAIPTVILACRVPRAAALLALAANIAFLLDEYALPARFQRTEGLVILALLATLVVTATKAGVASIPRRLPDHSG